MHPFQVNRPNETNVPNWKEGADSPADATGAVISRFRAALQTVQASELERLYGRLPKLNDRSREEIRQFSDRLVAKLLEPPLESLGQRSGDSSSPALLDALQRLFQLNRIAGPLPLTEDFARITE